MAQIVPTGPEGGLGGGGGGKAVTSNRNLIEVSAEKEILVGEGSKGTCGGDGTSVTGGV